MIVDIAPRRSPSRSKSSSACWRSTERLHERRRDRQLRHDVLQDLARRHALHDREVLAQLELLDEPRAHPAELDHAELAGGGGLDRHVAELPRELHRAAERLVARRPGRPPSPPG